MNAGAVCPPVAVCPPGGVVFWFRSDLRLHDNPALTRAVEVARARRTWLLPVLVLDPAQTTAHTRWGFARQGTHRRRFVAESVAGLAASLQRHGAPLWVFQGDPLATLGACMKQTGASELVCEDIPAPEEQAAVTALRLAGLRVTTVWQTTLFAPDSLPMPPERVPDTFTAFRQKLEASGAREANPLPVVAAWPCAPGATPVPAFGSAHPVSAVPPGAGSEAQALNHLARYCDQGLPSTYKTTRNALMGADASTHWSPWLATGALSARQAMAAIRRYEAERGASQSTYWLWFELLWRDHFRWMHVKHGVRLYRARGLSQLPAPAHRPEVLARWREGRTGQPLVDAGMRELAATGWLSNRMRQVVAGFWVHDLGGDWRAGAAWFEHALIDFDPCSNQGNWAYIAGRGTDPRGGRRFNTEKQTQEHDPHGLYRKRWGTLRESNAVGV